MQWEYKVIEISVKTNLETELNVWGVKGWELSNTYFYGGWTLIFKRLVNK